MDKMDGWMDEGCRWVRVPHADKGPCRPSASKALGKPTRLRASYSSSLPARIDRGRAAQGWRADRIEDAMTADHRHCTSKLATGACCRCCCAGRPRGREARVSMSWWVWLIRWRSKPWKTVGDADRFWRPAVERGTGDGGLETGTETADLGKVSNAAARLAS